MKHFFFDTEEEKSVGSFFKYFYNIFRLQRVTSENFFYIFFCTFICITKIPSQSLTLFKLNIEKNVIILQKKKKNFKIQFM